jgi:hypothetical protein
MGDSLAAAAISADSLPLMPQFPTFVDALPLTRGALEFAAERHDGQRGTPMTPPFILHPLEVAQLLRSYGYPDEMVAAGVLHDSLENTDATPLELEQRFGSQVAALGVRGLRAVAHRHLGRAQGKPPVTRSPTRAPTRAIVYAGRQGRQGARAAAQAGARRVGGGQPGHRRAGSTTTGRALAMLERRLPDDPLVMNCASSSRRWPRSRRASRRRAQQH